MRVRITVEHINDRGNPVQVLESFDWVVKKWKGIFHWAKKNKKKYNKMYSD
jgi:hypothetical protein